MPEVERASRSLTSCSTACPDSPTSLTRRLFWPLPLCLPASPSEWVSFSPKRPASVPVTRLTGRGGQNPSPSKETRPYPHHHAPPNTPTPPTLRDVGADFGPVGHSSLTGLPKSLFRMETHSSQLRHGRETQVQSSGECDALSRVFVRSWPYFRRAL